MNPNQYYNSMSTKSRASLIKRWLVLALVVLLVIWAGMFAYRQIVFRVSKTDPNMNHVATATAYIKIYFNKPITSSGLNLSYSSSFISKYEVHDKEIDLTTKDGRLETGKRYTITINYVASVSGSVIKNKKLSFVAQNIPISKVSTGQQSALVKRQDKPPYEAQYINFVGFDTLLQGGLSTNQMSSLKEDLFGYSNQINQKFWTITLVPNSLAVVIHNAESSNLTDSYTFNVMLGGSAVAAHVISDPIEDQLQLQLLDGNGTVVYDSINAHD